MGVGAAEVAVLPGAAYAIALEELLDPPVEARFDHDAPPDEPVELVAPDAGACELLVVDEDGAPWTEPLELWVQLLPAGGVDEDELLIDVTRPVRDGRVRLDYVTPGRQLLVGVVSATLGEQEVLLPGPEWIGQRVTRTVHVESHAVTLSGRAVDEAGAPLRELELEPALERGPSGLAERFATLTTDAQGRFELDLPPEPDGPCPHALVLSRRLDSGEELASGRAPLPPELASGRNELGDVRLATSLVLASGRVVDARGQPVPGAEVRRYRTETYRNDPTRISWRGLVPQLADARGRFTVRGEEAQPTLGLAASRDGVSSELVEVSVGAQEVELRLGAVGGLRGRVLLDRSLDPCEVRVEALFVDGAPRLNSNARGALAHDGDFALRNLAPGDYRVRFQWQQRILAWTDSVRVEADDEAVDPRLDPLDLRAAWRRIGLEVVDERGATVPEGEVLVLFADDDWDDHDVLNGRASVLLRDEPVDLLVGAEGFLTRRFREVSEDLAVELRPAPRVRLVLAGVDPPAPPLRVQVELEPAADPPEESEICLEAELGPDGRALVRPPFTGRARARLYLARRGAPREEIDPDTERLVDIADAPDEQIVELRIAPAALVDAGGRLGR